MGNASVVSLEEFRQARLHTAARQRLHEQFDRWLDQVESRVKEKPPTLEQLTQAVCEMRQDLLGQVTQSLVEQAHGQSLTQGRARLDDRPVREGRAEGKAPVSTGRVGAASSDGLGHPHDPVS